jgi:hypothetical protein
VIILIQAPTRGKPLDVCGGSGAVYPRAEAIEVTFGYVKQIIFHFARDLSKETKEMSCTTSNSSLVREMK